jgi:hypothetical protein
MSGQQIRLLRHWAPRSTVVGCVLPPCWRSDKHIAAQSDHRRIGPETVLLVLVLVLAAGSPPAPAPDTVVAAGHSDKQPFVVVKTTIAADGVGGRLRPHQVIREDSVKVKHDTILWACGL